MHFLIDLKPFWINLTYVLRNILDNFRPFSSIWDLFYFEVFWTFFGSFWTFLDHFGHFEKYGEFLNPFRFELCKPYREIENLRKVLIDLVKFAPVCYEDSWSSEAAAEAEEEPWLFSTLCSVIMHAKIWGRQNSTDCEAEATTPKIS